MLFFTSGRARAPRRSRDAASWLDAMSAGDAATALRHARDDIADAARQLRAAVPDHPEDLITDDLIPMGRDAVRNSVKSVKAAQKSAQKSVKSAQKSVEKSLESAQKLAPVESVQKLMPSRRRRRRGPVFGLVAALLGVGVLFLATQMLLRRPALPMRLSRGWTPGRRTSWPPTDDGVSEPVALATPATLRPPEALPADATTEPATFDRDAGIRAATEGMVPPEPMTPESSPSRISDGE